MKMHEKNEEKHVKAIHPGDRGGSWLFDLPLTLMAFSNACQIVSWIPLNANKVVLNI